MGHFMIFPNTEALSNTQKQKHCNQIIRSIKMSSVVFEKMISDKFKFFCE